MMISLLIFVSCRTQKTDGYYEDDGRHRFLQLNKDSSFNYRYYFDRISSSSYGIWKNQKNKIILISTPPVGLLKMNVKATLGDTKHSKIYVKFDDHYKKAFSSVNLYVNGHLFKKYAYTNREEIVVNENIKTLFFEFYGNFDYWMNLPKSAPDANKWTTEVFENKDPQNAEFDITINMTEDTFYWAPFNHTVLKKKRNKLVSANPSIHILKKSRLTQDN